MKEKPLKEIGRIVAGAYYDMQEIRKAATGRIRDFIRKKSEGIESDEVEEKKAKEEKELGKYSDENLPEQLKQLEKKGILTQKEYEYIEKCLGIAEEIVKVENKYRRAMLEYISTEPVFNVFLNKIRGIGEILSANLIKEFGYCEVLIYDREKKKIIGRETGDKKQFAKAMKLREDDPERYARRGYDNVAKLWAHTGNDVTAGVAPKKRKGQDLTFSPRLRTLTWKISDCLMKSNKGIYRQLYSTTKERYLAKEYAKGELKEAFGKPYGEKDTKLKVIHAHNRALRNCRKLFLSHYWSCSRELMELPIRKPYIQEKLGHKDIITWRDALKREK